MNLSEVMKDIEFEPFYGDEEIDVKGIAYDSRQVKEGYAFVCISGFNTDGHKYVKSAIELGAKIIVAEKNVDTANSVCVVKVKNTRATLAKMGSNFYGNPSKKMNMVGVTGTNGKTSTTYIIKSVLDTAMHKVGIIGTIENRIGDKVLHTERTTPESLDLQKLLNDMVVENVDSVVMEVSSHALDLNRVDCCEFDVGVFTNLTQDHLDYHVNMENYKMAKAKLFQISDKSVINIDDEVGNYMLGVAKGKVLTVGIDKKAHIMAKDIKMSYEGIEFDLVYLNESQPIKLNMLGKFSVYNVLVAVGACIFMEIPMDSIIRGIEEIKGIRGRFETIKSPNGFGVVVDYAHTPDGLENVLKTAKEFGTGSIITIFGCGGDRDKTKRPIMGEIAGRLSNHCIITNDNPRSENPEIISKEIEVGIKKTACPFEKVLDRREAIFKAVLMAKKGDIVIIAGKGHETYQIFSDKTIHFDDKEVVLQAFGEVKQ